MNAKLSERQRSEIGVSPQDITTARTGTYVSVAGHRRIQAIAVTGNITAGQTVTIELMQATSAGGAGAKALGAPVVVTASSTAPQKASIDARVDELDTNNGYGFVAVRLSSNNGTAVQGGAVLLLADGRFSE